MPTEIAEKGEEEDGEEEKKKEEKVGEDATDCDGE